MHNNINYKLENIVDEQKLIDDIFKTNALPLSSSNPEDLQEYFPDLGFNYSNMSGITLMETLLTKLKNTDEFISKIKQYKNKNICIVGDYDCDGITATTIIYCALRQVGYRYLDFYIPNRLTDGYGLSKKFLESNNFKKADLIITVDNGIGCKDVIKKILDSKKDVLVTDHHIPDEGKTPEDVVIVDPKYNGDEFADISGATVALKLMYALYKDLGKENYFPSDILIPLAGISTISDMMPLLKENRHLVKFTFDRINESKGAKAARYSKPYLFALREIISAIGGYIFINNPTSIADENLISFYIAPTMNSQSRVYGDVSSLVSSIIRTILCGDYLASLYRVNIKRKAETTALLTAIPEREYAESKIVLFNEADFDFQIKGILGLIANRVADSENKISLVGTRTVLEDGTTKLDFSARSVPGYNLYEGINRVKGMMTNEAVNIEGGGHASAMGIRLTSKNPDCADILEKYLNEDISKNKTELVKHLFKVESNGEMDIAINALYKFHPFGQNFKAPTFIYSGEVTEFSSERKEINIGGYVFSVLGRNLEAMVGKKVNITFNISFEDSRFTTLRLKDIEELEGETNE